MSFLNKLLLHLNLIHKNKISKKNFFSFSGVDVIIGNIFRKKIMVFISMLVVNTL